MSNVKVNTTLSFHSRWHSQLKMCFRFLVDSFQTKHETELIFLYMKHYSFSMYLETHSSSEKKECVFGYILRKRGNICLVFAKTIIQEREFFVVSIHNLTKYLVNKHLSLLSLSTGRLLVTM